jgi:hypothetical protein
MAGEVFSDGKERLVWQWLPFSFPEKVNREACAKKGLH